MATDTNLKIAVIGPTQSGKTCLAVGLVSTNTSGFSIQSVDEDSRAYLADLKVDLRPTKDEHGNLRPGIWPGASNLGTNKALRFDFMKKGKRKIRVGFPEYSGEMLQPDKFKPFANEHLRGLDGVLLLVNPGADAFQKCDQRVFEDYMAQYEHVLTFLRDPNNESDKAFVALTVTAADRINGDLQGKLDPFNECIQRLSNTLGTSGFNWKRFNVTVTGHLKDQNQPALAQGRRNLASAPFLWLLDELNWRPKREEIFRRVRNYSFIVAGIAALCGVAYGVYAWNTWEKIGREKTGLEQVTDKARNTDDLNEIMTRLGSLQRQTGLFAERAKSIASELVPKVWSAFEREINREINAIRVNPEKYGSDQYCNGVDCLFAMWQPRSADCRKMHEQKKSQWEKDKLGYQDRFAAARMLAEVRRPLDECIVAHGGAAINAIRLFYGLYGKLDTAKPIYPESMQLKRKLSDYIDARVEEVWRGFAIRDFDVSAKTNATDEATRDFVSLLDAWKPITTNGVAAKVELLASVSNSIPKWRTNYEVAHFSSMKGEAIKNRSLEALAKLYHARVVTNEYLTLEYVTAQWNNGIQAAYEETCANYITNFINTVVARRGRPALGYSDEEAIAGKAAAVGAPFDKAKVTTAILAAVGEMAEKWEVQKRNECADWVDREIKSRPDRKGHELMREYIREKRKHQDHEEIFNETIRREVYSHCERSFDEDVAFFKSRYSEKSECEKRFNEYFKPLCEIIAEDAKDPDEISWAIRFAKGCVDTGKVKDGFANAFQEEFKVTSVCGKIDYSGENPLKGFLGTKFGVVVFRDSDNGSPTAILERDESPVVKNDKEWIELSNDEGWKAYTSFANPLNFGMSVHDDRDGEWDYRRSYNDKDVQGFLRPFDPFYDAVSNEICIELGGAFGKQTEERKLSAYVQVNMKRASGCGICVLLSRAKASPKGER